MPSYGSIKAKVVRLTRLDECSVPVIGAASTVVSSGFTKLEPAPEYEDGVDFNIKNAWGDFCVNEQDLSRLKQIGMGLEFCQVDPAIADIAANMRLLLDGSDVAGAALSEGANESRFAVETWTKVAGQACVGGLATWLYWVWPALADGRLGNFTIENAALTLPMQAKSKGAVAEADFFSNGPYDTSYLPDGLDVGEHFAFAVTTETPPTVTDGAVALAAYSGPGS